MGVRREARKGDTWTRGNPSSTIGGGTYGRRQGKKNGEDVFDGQGGGVPLKQRRFRR